MGRKGDKTKNDKLNILLSTFGFHKNNMGLVKSQTNNLSNIFNGNNFVIPEYQRKYSWKNEQRQQLWDDIIESKDNTNHFIGTLAFHEINKNTLSTDEVYEVIDGQQRITTLYILLDVLINKLSDSKEKETLRNDLIGTPDKMKLTPLGVDGDFLKKVIFNFTSINIEVNEIRSQRQLYSAKVQFKALSSNFDEKESQNLILFILKKIEILVFNVESISQAVKMFSIINDRGLPLSILDKVKSTLMMYSTMYLNEELNHDINVSFGKIFDSFDSIMFQKDNIGIIKQFDEGTLFTQHYYTQRKLFNKNWNYKIGANQVFKNIKLLCEQNKNNAFDLKTFIQCYTEDLKNFSYAYERLIKEVKIKPEYQKPFRYLEFSGTLFPLIVRLFEQNKLDFLITTLENVELRVYKLKNTNPRWNMYDLSSTIVEHSLTINDIKDRLIGFSNNFMNDYLFENYLNDNIYRNASVKYILYEFNNENYSLEFYKSLQKEHIYPTTPKFDIEKHGFITIEYDYEKDRLGNIIMLEKNLNNNVDNNSPYNKVDDYLESKLIKTRNMGGAIQQQKINKSYVDNRRQEIIAFCKSRFGFN